MDPEAPLPDVVQWVPILVALVALCGGLVGYWNQKRIDRGVELQTRRPDCYLRFMDSLLRVGADPAALAAFNAARMELALIASDRVLRAAAAFSDYASRTSPPAVERDMSVFKSLLADVVAEMRRDGFEETKLSGKDLAFALPIQD